jgi:hypothetical protein
MTRDHFRCQSTPAGRHELSFNAAGTKHGATVTDYVAGRICMRSRSIGRFLALSVSLTVMPEGRLPDFLRKYPTHAAEFRD